jgi:glycosyltransferase involved in cell wall biosynthesis
MNILFSDVTYSYLHPGGKQVHAAQLMAHLTRKGVVVGYENWHDPRLRPDVVHFFGYNDTERLRAMKRRGIRLVYTHIMDGLTNQSVGWQRYHRLKAGVVKRLPRRVEALMPWRGLELFDAIVYMHRADREAAIRIYGVDPAKTRIIPHGVEAVGEFQAAAEATQRRYLVSLGSIVPRKNSLFTAEVCRDAQVPVTFVGHAPDSDTAYHRQFLAVIRESGGVLRADVGHEEKLRLLRNASGFVLLSHGESGCISVYEAAATGLPLLLSDLPWAKGYEEPTWLEQCSPMDRLGAVERVRDFFGRASRQGQPTIRVRTWDEIADMYRDTYRAVLDGGPVEP